MLDPCSHFFRVVFGEDGAGILTNFYSFRVWDHVDRNAEFQNENLMDYISYRHILLKCTYSMPSVCLLVSLSVTHSAVY